MQAAARLGEAGSFPEILGGIANPIEPLRFQFVLDGPLPPLPADLREGLWPAAELPDPADKGQPHVSERIHCARPSPVGWPARFR